MNTLRALFQMNWWQRLLLILVALSATVLASDTFYTDTVTARYLDTTTNSLLLLRESGVGDKLPLLWSILFLSSAILSATLMSSQFVVALAFASFVLTLLTNSAFIFALTLCWGAGLAAIATITHTRTRITCLAAAVLVGSLFLGPLQIVALLCALCFSAFASRFIAAEAVLLLLPALYATLSIKNPFTDSYPPGATVVERSGATWMGRPFFGYGFDFPIVDKAAVGEVLLYPLSAIGLVLVILLALQKLRNSKTVLWMAIIAAALIYLDLFTPPAIADVSPLAVLQRLIPGIWGVTLAPIAFGLLVFLILYSLRSRAPLLGVTVMLIGIALLNAPKPRPDNATAFRRDIVISPSAAVIDAAQLRSAEQITQLKQKRFMPTAAAFTVPHFDANVLFDNDPQTRIRLSNKIPSSLCIAFKKPQVLDGIIISTGDYLADFPRGISVSSKADCNSDAHEVLFSQDTWLGRVRVSTTGHPYYSSQSDVRIPFPRTMTVTALVFEQRGFDATFDWSVAELKYLSREAD